MSSNLDANQSSLRGYHHLKGYVTFFKGALKATAEVTDVGTEFWNVLTVSTLTGTIDSSLYDATVVIMSSALVYKGTTRVSRGTVPTSTTIEIPDLNDSNIALRVGDILYIYDSRGVWPRFPSMSIDFEPDNEAYTNQTEAIAPIAISNGPYVRMSGTVDFYGDDSYAVDDDSGGSLTHSWVFPTGSTPTSSTSANPSGVVIPDGAWWVKHIVTDSSNSKTHTQWVPTAINSYYEAEITGISGTAENGWQFEFTLRDNFDLDTIPDGCAVAFWVEENDASYGAMQTGNSNVKFFGWLDRDTQRVNYGTNTVTFHAISTLERLNRVAGFSHVFSNAITATSWQEIEGLTVHKAIITLLRNYTTVLSVADLHLLIDDSNYPQFFVQTQTPYQQVVEIADALDGVFCQDRRLALMVKPNLHYLQIDDRDAKTRVLTLSEEDVIELEVIREHDFKVQTIEVRGIIPSDDGSGSPVFALFPGRAPGTGTINEVQDRLITSSQADLNRRAGQRGAFKNRVYSTANRYKQAPTVHLTLVGNYDVFDFYDYYLAFSITTVSQRDDLDFFKYVIDAIEVSYEQGTQTVRLTLQAETYARPAETYIPPAVDDTQSLPEYDYDLPPIPEVELPDIDVIWPEPTGGISVACIMSDGHIWVTNDFESATPTWNDYNHSATITGTRIVWTLDASSAYYTSGSGAVGGWICSTDKIWYVDDVFSATPTITPQHTFASSTAIRNMDADYVFDVGNFLVVVSNYYGSQFKYMVSTDGGATWGTETAVGNSGALVEAGVPGLHVSTSFPNTAYFFAWNAFTDHPFFYYVDGTVYDHNLVGDYNLYGTGLHFHFGDNFDRYGLYGYKETGLINDYRLYRTDFGAIASVDGPIVTSDISPLIGGLPSGPNGSTMGKFFISSAMNDRNKLMVTTYDGGNYSTFFTNNWKAPYPVWQDLTGPNSTYLYCNLNANGNTGYVYGLNGSISYWNGTTLEDKSFTTTGEIMGIAVKA